MVGLFCPLVQVDGPLLQRYLVFVIAPPQDDVSVCRFGRLLKIANINASFIAVVMCSLAPIEFSEEFMFYLLDVCMHSTVLVAKLSMKSSN